MRVFYRIRSWLPLLPLAALLAVTYWLDQQVRPEAPPAKHRHEADAVMENFSAVKMNESGTPHFVLVSSRMRHYPDDDTSELDAPRLASIDEGRPTVRVAALRGNISGDGDVVLLHEQVEVLREASADRSEMRLQTDFLRVVPDRDWAETDRPVVMLDDRNTVHAVGLEMDNKARTLKLLAQVRSVHEPH